MGKFISIIFFSFLCVFNFIDCDVSETSLKQILFNDTESVPEEEQIFNFSDYGNSSYTDAQNLYDAIAGLGTDEDVIINILTNRTNQQRQLIAEVYQNMFQKELISDLKGDLSGNFKNVIKALVLKPEYYMAKELRRALTSFVTDDDCLAEILCTKERDELVKIMNAYKKLYNRTLTSQIEDNLEGDQMDFFKYILKGKLRGNDDANDEKAEQQVNAIPHVNDFCTIDENHQLLELLTKESFQQIALVGKKIEAARQRKVLHLLEAYCTKNDLLRDAYITVVRFSMDPVRYYAQELYAAVIGLGTNDDKLQRIIVGRSEIDLFDIKNKYEELYNRTLISSIEADTSGYYRKTLIRLIEDSDRNAGVQTFFDE